MLLLLRLFCCCCFCGCRGLQDSKLACPVDHTPLEIMVVGDSKQCRLCLINDVAYWGQEMEQQGWGPCLQAAKGTCNCDE